MAVKEIEGFDEFQRDTDRIQKELPNQTRQSSVEMAAQWVSAAKANVHTAQESLAAQSLVSMSSGDGAQIECLSPLFYGAEFGGQGRPETMQFPPFNGSRGYWFYQARRNDEPRYEDIWSKGIDNAMSPWDRSG